MAKDPLSALNPRQRAFVRGVAEGLCDSEAYIQAGYKARGASARSGAARLLTNANVNAALNAIQQTTPEIASRADRQKFWTEVMYDGNASMKDRLKASELLGKAGADFTERREVNLNIDPASKLREAFLGDEDEAGK